MTELAVWNETFGITGQIEFIQGQGGMPVVMIENKLAQASIALQGAHLLSFQVNGEAPLIWMSEDAVYAPAKSLRGGIPICWPWFGPHATDESMPAHGCARTNNWKPIASKANDDGSTRVSFELIQTEASKAVCSHPLNVQLHVTVGTRLHLVLETTNLGDAPFTLGQALHTYFQVGDVSKASVEGFDGLEYIDKVKSGGDYGEHKIQQGPITISSEVDRIYLNSGKCCEIIDPILQRKIIIACEGSASTVVWNPWIDIATRMGDLGPDGYLNMLCVETTNAADDVIELAAGATHRLVADYSSQAL